MTIVKLSAVRKHRVSPLRDNFEDLEFRGELNGCAFSRVMWLASAENDNRTTRDCPLEVAERGRSQSRLLSFFSQLLCDVNFPNFS